MGLASFWDIFFIFCCCTIYAYTCKFALKLYLDDSRAFELRVLIYWK